MLPPGKIGRVTSKFPDYLTPSSQFMAQKQPESASAKGQHKSAPPAGPPPPITLLSICSKELPELRARKAKLTHRLEMQRGLLAKTEAELREIEAQIASRDRQQAKALQRLNEEDERARERERIRASRPVSPRVASASRSSHQRSRSPVKVWPRGAQRRRG